MSSAPRPLSTALPAVDLFVAPSSLSTIRVLLVDDHKLVRRGISDLLSAEDDIEVVGEASNGDEAVERVGDVRPHVAILDVQLGEGERSGVEVCREIRAAHPEIACLMLTSSSDAATVASATVAGASGYLLKQIMGTQLVDSIRIVAAGNSLL